MVQGVGPQGRPGGLQGVGGEAGRSPDGRDARRSGRKSADAARRAAGLRPGVPAAGRGAKGPRRSRGQGIIRRPRR